MNFINFTKLVPNSTRLLEDVVGIENREDAFTMIAVLSLASNLLLLAVLVGVPKLRSAVNCLVMNLCASSVFYTLTGCIRLAEMKGMLTLRGYDCLIWRASQKLGSWLTASALIAISLHECCVFSRLAPRFPETSRVHALTKIVHTWIVAVVTSSYTLLSFCYDSFAPENASCNEAIILKYPLLELWENISAFIVFYLWNFFHITCELLRIRGDIRDLMCGKFETRNRLLCEDDIQLQRKLKRVKYIVCYSMIYLIFWVPQGVSEVIWAFLNVTNPKGPYPVLYGIKEFFDNGRHPMVCVFPVIFVLLSCSFKDLKQCCGTCKVQPFEDEDGAEEDSDIPAEAPNSPNSAWVIQEGENTIDIEISDSQFSVSERDSAEQIETQL